jgi:hypothetical protein
MQMAGNGDNNGRDVVEMPLDQKAIGRVECKGVRATRLKEDAATTTKAKANFSLEIIAQTNDARPTSKW